MDEKEYNKRKHEILSKIFITKEEAEEYKLNNVNEVKPIKRGKYRNVKREIIDNTLVKIGNLFREYDIINNVCDENKELMMDLFEFISDNLEIKKSQKLDIQLERHLKIIKKLRKLKRDMHSEKLKRGERIMKFCIENNELYLSNPPQRKCKHCGQMWNIRDHVPYCKKQDALDKEGVQNE